MLLFLVCVCVFVLNTSVVFSVCMCLCFNDQCCCSCKRVSIVGINKEAKDIISLLTSQYPPGCIGRGHGLEFWKTLEWASEWLLLDRLAWALVVFVFLLLDEGVKLFWPVVGLPM